MGRIGQCGKAKGATMQSSAVHGRAGHARQGMQGRVV